MVNSFVININILIGFLIIIVTSQEYPFATWMNTLSSKISSKTIFEIVLPGSHKSGMSWSNSLNIHTDQLSAQASDEFNIALQTLAYFEQQKDWSQRQTLSIYNQLMSGIRYLDLQFEYNDQDSTYYTYNGLYGLTVNQILDGINQFLSETNTENEIIILSLNDFISPSSSNINFELIQLFNIIIKHPINSKIIKSNIYDITTQTISQLTDNNVNIIIFVDLFPSTTTIYNEWFYVSDLYINANTNPSRSNKPNITDPISETQSIIINDLRYGWDRNKLNLIYYIPLLSTTFVEKWFYTSWFEFNSQFSHQLHSFINHFPKLWFANILISDFVGSADIVQQSIILNIKYANCNDFYTHWGEFNSKVATCLSLSNLPQTFVQNTVPTQCQNSETDQNNCQRSCGICPLQYDSNGNPGDSCKTNANCNGEIYQIFSVVGTCVQPPNSVNQSICLSVFPQESCIDYWSIDFDQCSDVNLTQCSEHCGTNYQCLSGFCNSKLSVCMDYNTSTEWKSFWNSEFFSILRYWPFMSKDAHNVLARLEPFRPGNSSAAYSDSTGEAECNPNGAEAVACVFDNVSYSPYMTSVLGLVLIPMILSMILCVCYCCIWPWWCCCEMKSKIHCCDKCCKKCYSEDTGRCCCDNDPLKCIGTPEDSPWIHWIPCVILGIAIIVSLWACIDGLIANSEIHEAIFDEPTSLQGSTDTVLTEVIDRLTSVQPSMKYIISSTFDILSSTLSIIAQTYNTETQVQEMNEAFNTLTTHYSKNSDLTATVINPFTYNTPDVLTISFTIQCEQCDTVSDTALDAGRDFDIIISKTLNILVETISKFEPLYEVRQNILEHTQVLFTDLDGVIETISNKHDDIMNVFDTASEIDTQYRETWIAFFLSFTLILVILPIIGMICQWKWCFKINWCFAMIIGTILMFITSFGALIIVLWGDFCVRLDEFEQYKSDSQFGQMLTLNEEKMNLVNACMTGQSIIELYGLDDVFNWDPLRIEVKKALTDNAQDALYFEQLAIFKAELQSLSTDEFTQYVDKFINFANNLGNYCGCGSENILFTRNNLFKPINNCTINNRQEYWDNLNDNNECAKRYINASFAVQAEYELLNETQIAINELKNDARQIFLTYDSKIYPLGLQLYNDLQNLSCIVDPLFNAIDEVVYNFSNCGFIGEFYGEIKENGCIVLFNRTYYIARALCIIAFMTIIIVFFSYCMDYIYGPPSNKNYIYKENNHQSNKMYDEIPVDNNNNNNNNYYDTDDEGRALPDATVGATVELIGNNDTIHVVPSHDDNDQFDDDNVLTAQSNVNNVTIEPGGVYTDDANIDT